VRRMSRAGVLAGAGALAAVSFACRTQDGPPVECLRLEGPRKPVGFGATFSIKATLDCPQLAGGRVMWRQVEGIPLAATSVTSDGFELTARLASLAESVGGVPWGVVPISPRTRGEIALVATWADNRGVSVARQIRVAAADRSRGLPNTPVGVRIYLGGDDWRVTARPMGSGAALETTGGIASLLPDVAGDWRLADAGGRTLALRSGRYDETPLDCGRAGCHRAITDAVVASPMTTVFARLMDAIPRPAGYPDCALACHTTGEPGAHDGGFPHVASELAAGGDRTADPAASPRDRVAGGVGPIERPPLLDRRWDALPRDLHRLGGVGCLACHGPGAIPEASARWGILRTDVCAVCHDAPPRYGHVVALRQSAMARADQNPRARSERACARCHTTAGFLAAVATPERAPVDRSAPDGAGPVGITCSACHAVHDPRRPDGATRLLRSIPVPALLANAPRNICLSCHTPDAADTRPSASAAAIWRGRGGLDPATGQPLTGGAPHGAITGGCVGCHRGGPENLERGGNHAFRAPASVCTPCHPQGPPAATDLRARARELWRHVQIGESGGPAHAGDTRVDRRTPRGRAIWDLLLVLEDPAAAAHNARYAGALLDAAEPVILAGDANPRRSPR
jgi:hypothetical protein